MDSMYTHLYNHASQALPPIKHQSQFQTSGSDFPILTVSVLSAVITVFMLLCYYIFVVKCCINNRHQLTLLRRFSLSQAQRSSEDSLMSYSPTTLLNRGLDESFIRDLPTSQFSRRGGEIGCVFCLSEFQDEDILRVLPKCNHAFHLDCIDVWLQSNSNCPLCRSSIISGAACYPNDHITAPSSSPQGSQPFMGSFMGSDEDFVVIELGGEQSEAIVTNGVQEQEDYSRDTKIQSRISSPNKLMKRKHCKSKLPNGSSMGDECLDVRGRDDQFSVQPIRRSISLNSAAERQLFLSVQEALRQKSKNQSEESSAASEGSCSSRIRRSFFPFGNGRGSRNAVIPIEI